MFEVRDKVVHPQHGAGIVIGFKDDVLKGFGRYYVIDLVAYERIVMIPVDGADDIGLRQISAPTILARVSRTLMASPTMLPGSYTERQADIGQRLKTGDIIEVAGVVRDLAWHGHYKKLTTVDSSLFDQARKFLTSELALVKDIDMDEAMGWVDRTLDECWARIQALE
jgi:CarD family transcriptional regulator